MSIFMTKTGSLSSGTAGSIRCSLSKGPFWCMTTAGFLICSAAGKRILDAYGNISACRGRINRVRRGLRVKDYERMANR